MSLVWKKSKKGNLWTIVNGYTITIFKRQGKWEFCVAGPGRNQVYSGNYRSQQEAMTGATDAAKRLLEFREPAILLSSVALESGTATEGLTEGCDMASDEDPDIAPWY